MSMKWSAKNNAFFYPDDIQFYESADWDLNDLIDIDLSTFNKFKISPAGKERGVDHDGMPCWIDVIPPGLSYEEAVAVAESQKAFLLQSASQKISIWQTQLQLGMISDSNKQKLIEWMTYIEAVQAIDTSSAPNISWPTQPEA